MLAACVLEHPLPLPFLGWRTLGLPRPRSPFGWLGKVIERWLKS